MTSPRLTLAELDALARLVADGERPLAGSERVGAWIDRERAAAAAMLAAAPALLDAARKVAAAELAAVIAVMGEADAPPVAGTKARCRGCGRAIVWHRTTDGRPMPLDATAPVYALDELTRDGQRVQVVERTRTAWVSHFVTCPQRDQFRKAKPEGTT